MNITFKKLRPDAIIPHSATKQSAGLDLHACLDVPLTLNPGECVTIHCGVACCPEDENVVMLVFIRSSMGRLHQITLANSVGVIDSDYRGEIMVPIINHGTKPYTLEPGERFAQLVVVPAIFANVLEAETLPETERGEKGFGSTGRL